MEGLAGRRTWGVGRPGPLVETLEGRVASGFRTAGPAREAAVHAWVVNSVEATFAGRMMGDAGAVVGSAARGSDRTGPDEQRQESAGRKRQPESSCHGSASPSGNELLPED